ncbi:MAG: type II CAAX endopeptidase family protein [candidate division KSB1 bacterium]|jgi:membrane protease YdiL (CAAX protease family)|nr:type II CAAX endopeptidase family protein [candidate division KSB1 bacterium]
MENNRSRIPDQNQALFIIVITGAMIIFGAMISILLGLQKSQFLLIEGMTILPALVYAIRKKFSLVETFRLKAIQPNILITSILLGLALSVLADEADRLIAIFFPMPDAFQDILKQAMEFNGAAELISLVFSAVILAGVCEEMLFRGFVQKSFEHAFDVTKAIMLTSLIFAVVHLNPWWTIQIIIFAIFLGVMAWKSDSIYPSIIAHSTNNALALIFSNVEDADISWYLSGDHVDPFVIIAALIVMVIGFQQFYRYCDEQKRQISQSPHDQDWNHSIR